MYSAYLYTAPFCIAQLVYALLYLALTSASMLCSVRFGSVRFGSVRLCYAMLYFVQLLSFCSTSPLLSSAKPLSRPFSTTTTTTTTLLYLSSAARICTSLHYIVLQGVFTVNILTIAGLFIRPISHRSAQSDHGDVIQIFAYWMRTDLVACGKQINSLRY